MHVQQNIKFFITFSAFIIIIIINTIIMLMIVIFIDR